jgi:hypothetical protein
MSQLAGVVRARQPVDRRGCSQRWRDTVTKLLALHAAYATWFEALPDTLRGTAPADALQAIVDLDLDRLAAVELPAATAATDESRCCGQL